MAITSAAMGDPDRSRPWSDARHSELVRELLGVLGGMFDLGHSIAGSTLGEVMERRLVSLADVSSPCWGTQGEMTEIARHSSGALEFFYRPHLFPDMEDGLRLAHQLQFDLLPRSLPAGSRLGISAVLESYCHLSGDLLGWQTEGEDLLVWIADVSGHGVRAGLAAAVLYVLSADAEPGLAPAVAATRLSSRMLSLRNLRDERPLYATAFWLRLGPGGRGRYTSAGHPSMLVRRADGGIETLASTGPPLGLLEGSRFEEEDLELRSGDLLLLFSDGLVEATDAAGAELGSHWLEEQLQAGGGAPGKTTRRIYDALSRRSDRSSMEDDLTFLAAAPIDPSAGSA